MSPLFLRLIKKRGIDENFLSPKYEECIDPFLLPDMERAVERILQAKEAGEKVLIYGDYDADGVTATTVMHDALKLAGVEVVKTMLPNRFTDGYGMNEKVVEEAKKTGAKLVITVDCGSGDTEVAQKLLDAGVDLIVTDHHECGEVLAKVPVINPKRKDVEVPVELKDLAGVGVAFKLVQALVQKGMIKAGREKWLLDLVLIGTICDNMAMTLENRRLCYFGLIVLKKTKRVGLRELMRVAGTKKIDTDVIGFQIGPRMNAAGRVETADKALELLLTESPSVAARLAEELEELNRARKEMQNAARREIEQRGVGNEPVIVESGDWHEGVLGIIAGNLTEKYKKPAFAFTKLETGYKGSGRSFGEFNLAQALSECQKWIVTGGGHAGACGVTVPTEGLDDFKRAINDYYRSLGLKNQERFLIQKEDLVVRDLAELNLKLIEELAKLEPFGWGNEEPIFKLEEMEVSEVRKMGREGEHLSLIMKDKKGTSLKLVAFYAPKRWLEMQVDEDTKMDVWVRLMDNDWNGFRTVEGKIERIEIR